VLHVTRSETHGERAHRPVVTASSRQRARLAAPVGRSFAGRSVLASVALHASFIVPLLATAVLVSARPPTPVVVAHAVLVADAEPLREEPPAPAPFVAEGRVEPQASFAEVEMAEPLLESGHFEAPAELGADPRRSGGLGQRYAPLERWKLIVRGKAPTKWPRAPVPLTQEYDAGRDYPALARSEGWEGVVRFELVIDADGCVRGFRLLDVAHASLSDAARDITRHWTFRAATRDGAAVMGTHQGAIDFRLVRKYEHPGPRPSGGAGAGESAIASGGERRAGEATGAERRHGERWGGERWGGDWWGSDRWRAGRRRGEDGRRERGRRGRGRNRGERE